MVKEKIIEKYPNAVVYDSSDATAWDVLTDLANSDVVIAANSTLSWWGAWLCVQNNGLAFLPSIWIRSSGEPPPNVIDGFIIHESVWD
jgi:hypothetical protein